MAIAGIGLYNIKQRKWKLISFEEHYCLTNKINTAIKPLQSTLYVVCLDVKIFLNFV